MNMKFTNTMDVGSYGVNDNGAVKEKPLLALHQQ
jgi:hypothetical protein